MPIPCRFQAMHLVWLRVEYLGLGCRMDLRTGMAIVVSIQTERGMKMPLAKEYVGSTPNRRIVERRDRGKARASQKLEAQEKRGGEEGATTMSGGSFLGDLDTD